MLERTEVAILLLGEEGIDVNIVARGGETALHEAARHNKTSNCLAMLLARPDLTTSVNQKDWGGETPLLLAVSRNAIVCVQLLISDKRVDPNIKSDRTGNSPLMLAVKGNRVACVELLISDCFDPNIKCDDGNSPLMLAVKMNNVDLVELLLADPRVDLMTRDNYQRSGEEVAR